MDQGRVKLTAQVRDLTFQPAVDARVTAHIVGPEGLDALVDLTPCTQHSGNLSSRMDGGEIGVISR